jgi:hypothetical protein
LLQLLNTSPACSDINWRASANGVQGVQVAQAPAGCELRDAGGNLLAANGAQPTLEELRALRNLDATTSATLPLNAQQVMVANVGGANQVLPPRFAVQITRTCVQHAGAVAAAAGHLNCSNGGNTGYWDLTSLVFNAQPFTDDAILTARGNNLMNLTFNAAGADALMATRGLQLVTNASGVDITNQFPLIAANRQPGEFVANPLRDPAGNGVANVLAVRGGFQSSVQLNRMRLDGGTRPTNNWNFGGFNLTDMGTLGVTTVNVSGTVTARNVSATNNVNALNVNATNNVNARNVSATNNVNALNVNATNKVATNFLQLNTQVAETASCGQDMLNAITLNSADPNRLLRCNGARWVPMIMGARYINSVTLTSGNVGYVSSATEWSCAQFIAVVESIFVYDLGKWQNDHYGTWCIGGNIFLYVNHPTSGMKVTWAIFEKT